MAGHVIYQGPSLLDGAPIVVIAITSSSNRKTGDMVQTYILRADVAPIAAIRTGADASICGDCKHRGVATGTKAVGRSCYVNVSQGPTVVYKGFLRGLYGTDAAEGLAMAGIASDGRMVRLGTYGDPAAVPVEVWKSLLAGAAGHTGYTHQWKRAPEYRTLLMASADTASEASEARNTGWRTFRVRCADEPLLEREAVCPASQEAGAKLHCAECGACNGAGTGRKGSIVIIAHGAVAGNFARNVQRI
jgi:hypothetical protein